MKRRVRIEDSISIKGICKNPLDGSRNLLTIKYMPDAEKIAAGTKKKIVSLVLMSTGPALSQSIPKRKIA